MDYNLFPVFVEIVRHRNVSKAASVLGITQSAASNALSRLRYMLGDKLFIRASHGVVPTEYALKIAGRIEAAVEELKIIGTEESLRHIEISGITRRFRIVASDLEESLIVPKLVEYLGKDAPGIQLEIRPYNRNTIKDEFQLNNADLVMAYLVDSYANTTSMDLLYQDFCCAVRKGHPKIKGSISLQEFIQHNHILVSPDKGGFHGLVDDKLKERGVKRKVVVSAPHFLSGCQLCAYSNHVITLPRFLAEQVADPFKLNLFELPFQMDGFTIGIHWHQRLDNDPEHKVIRELIQKIVRDQYHTLQ